MRGRLSEPLAKDRGQTGDEQESRAPGRFAKKTY